MSRTSLNVTPHCCFAIVVIMEFTLAGKWTLYSELKSPELFFLGINYMLYVTVPESHDT